MNVSTSWDGQEPDYMGDLLAKLPDKEGAHVLDIDCIDSGSSARLTDLGHDVTSITKPEDLQFCKQFDAVFSYASFHWFTKQDMLLLGIYRALKRGGALIAELGAQGNLMLLRDAFDKVLRAHAKPYRCPLFLPTQGEYLHQLTRLGFQAVHLECFSRRAILPHGKQGLRHLMDLLFSSELEAFDAPTQEIIRRDTEHILKDKLFDGQNWCADYQRLRVFALK